MSKFKNQSVETQDAAAPTEVTMVGALAEETIPSSVDDGDIVRLLSDLYGRLRIAGYSDSSNLLNVQEASPAALMTLEQTLLDAVTATGASSSVDVSNYHHLTIHVIASSVSTGGTVKVQTSLDGTNWYDKDTHTVGADGVSETVISSEKTKYVRANITARTDGTYTAKLFCGN